MADPTESELQPQGTPTFPVGVGGPTTTSWKEHALTRARELRYVTDWVRLNEDPRGENPAVQTAVQSIYDHLDAAREAADENPERKQRWRNRAKVSLGGASVERANSNLDAAESEVLRLASRDYVRGQMNNLLAHVRGHLPADDARRARIEEIAARGDHALTEVERDAVVAAVRIASIESRREITRVRSFRNVLFVTAGVLALAVAGLVALGATNPGLVPLCFNPEENEIVCPTGVGPVTRSAPTASEEPAAGGRQTAEQPPSQVDIDAAERREADSWDIPVIALIGLVAAAVAAAASLREVKGTSTPYTLPIALAILKLPTGALTAFLGLLLMRGEFVPGLSALDSPAQILAWAILFGYAQQLLTRLVDRQAQGVLDEVGKADRPALKPPETTPPQPAVTTDVAPQTWV